MSTTTQAIELIDELVKAKIPKQTATKLVDYADRGKERAVNLQWVAIGILAGGVFGGWWHLSSRIDTTRTEIKAEMNRRFDKIETEQKENRKLLLQVIQNQKR